MDKVRDLKLQRTFKQSMRLDTGATTYDSYKVWATMQVIEPLEFFRYKDDTRLYKMNHKRVTRR